MGANGSLWVSSWGNGVAEVVRDSVRRKISSTTTPSLTSTSASSPAFVVVGGVAADPEGNTWMNNYLASNGKYLAELVNDTTMH